jgi:hypothetical protein
MPRPGSIASVQNVATHQKLWRTFGRQLADEFPDAIDVGRLECDKRV